MKSAPHRCVPLNLYFSYRLSITILVGAVGCERRECDYVKSAKGDQICREDAEPEDDSEQAKSAEPGWGEERGAPK